MSHLTPARIAELTARMKPQSGEVVLLAFVQQQGTDEYLLAAPIPVTWPEMLAAVAHEHGIIPAPEVRA